MQPGRIDHQLGYILHAKAYRETSLLLDVFTREYGRVTLVARGARRPRAELRGSLLPLQPLTLSWFGKNEVRTLHKADWQGGVPQLAGRSLICGFYLNELMCRLTVRDDPHPQAWDAYDRAVHALGRGEPAGLVLRRFELALLTALGYAPALERDVHGRPVDAAQDYLCRADAAPEPLTPELPVLGAHVRVAGATLRALAEGRLDDAVTRREARTLTRLWLDALLGDEALATRELLMTGASGRED